MTEIYLHIVARMATDTQLFVRQEQDRQLLVGERLAARVLSYSRQFGTSHPGIRSRWSDVIHPSDVVPQKPNTAAPSKVMFAQPPSTTEAAATAPDAATDNNNAVPPARARASRRRPMSAGPTGRSSLSKTGGVVVGSPDCARRM